MSSRVGLSEGHTDKHHLMRCLHSGERNQKQPVSQRRLLSTLCHRPRCPGHTECAQSCTQASQVIIHFGEQDGRTCATSSN